jgi:hypothetical protein
MQCVWYKYPSCRLTDVDSYDDTTYLYRENDHRKLPKVEMEANLHSRLRRRV